jgi:hypothetical protein
MALSYRSPRPNIVVLLALMTRCKLLQQMPRLLINTKSKSKERGEVNANKIAFLGAVGVFYPLACIIA